MADKEVPLPADEKPESAEPAQKENVKSPVQSDESGLEPSTDKSLELVQISPIVSSGVEVNEPGSSERETTSPEPETGAVSGTSSVIASILKSPFRSSRKLISSTAKVMRKISPKTLERSKSPERPEDVADLKPQKTEKLWKLSPKAQNAPAEDEPGSSERETTSPEPDTGAVSGTSTAVSGTSPLIASLLKSPFQPPIKLISSTEKVMRKISPKKHERSKSPERPEDVADLKLQKIGKLCKLSPKAQNAPAEVEPFMKDDELESPDEILPKSAKEIVTPENPPEEVISPPILPKKRDVAYQRLDSETSDDSSITVTAEDKRESVDHKFPDSAELGHLTEVRLTQDTDWSLTTDESMADSSDEPTDGEVFSTSGRMSENLGLSENKEKVGSSKKLREMEKTVSSSPRKSPVKRHMPVESLQEKRDITNPSPSKRRTPRFSGPNDGPSNN